MFGLLRRFLLTILLGLSVAVPYLAMGDSLASVRSKITGFFATSGDRATADLLMDPATGAFAAAPSLTGQPTDPSLPGPTVTDLREVLRFDLTPRWIMSRWPRVTSVPGDGRFDGLRVPLVTGTGTHDLAGSLTYYFDKRQEVQRLTFHGYTGDWRNLVSVITHQYQLKPEPAVAAGIFVRELECETDKCLVGSAVALVSAANPYQTFEVILELNRPNNYASLSPQFENMLQYANARHASAATSY